MWLQWWMHVSEGTITVEGAKDRDKYNRNLALNTNALFISCISKINNTLIDNAEDVDVVVLMPVIEYSKTYSRALASLWNYYRDEPTNPPDDNHNADPTTNSESFK